MSEPRTNDEPLAPPSPQISAPWPERLAAIEETMREMSRYTDPTAMVRAYGARMRKFYRYDGLVSISRREMPAPSYRITRYSGWTEELDSWKDRARQPVMAGGILGELLYGDKPRLISDFRASPDDPAFEMLKTARTLTAIPHYDGGVGLNMVVTYRNEPHAVNPDQFPEQVWLSNLFGRAAGNLALSRELRELNTELDRETRVIAEIQRSLLPERLPLVPGLTLAATYQTSRNAGGDYYDFFALEGGKVGILIADVSGHGTPAAVLMAVLHAIAHLHAGAPTRPHDFLSFVNRHLCERYTRESGTFVTAFYGIYDPAQRQMVYSSAGHNPPRMRVEMAAEHGPVLSLDQAQGLPLGVIVDAEYGTAEVSLDPGDALVFYTDGITEAQAASGEMFDTERLDRVIARRHPDANSLLAAVLAEVATFTAGAPAGDDRTIVVAAAQ